jgi:DNA adenine methylase
MIQLPLIDCELPSIPKPLLKWVGGKTQIISKLIAKFPVEMNNYREIFLGGGSVLLALASCVRDGIIKLEGDIYAYDVNEALIYMYQKQPSTLHEEISKLITEYNTCKDGVVNRNAKTLEEAQYNKENYYYWIRSKYNKIDKKCIEASAMFIFLNKTCFRGVYREGPHGFNVPYGHYNNPEIINKTHLLEVSDIIKNVKFRNLSFEKSLREVEYGDYVYADPPYAQENINSFVSYTSDGFGLELHNKLFTLLHKLMEKKVACAMSNADVSLVRNSFSSYNIEQITCKRSINSKNPASTAKEVIVTNYSAVDATSVDATSVDATSIDGSTNGGVIQLSRVRK